MARPPNLTPVRHPNIIDGTPVFRRMYGHSVPCLLVLCPGCKETRWYPTNVLRQIVDRPSFNGACRACASSLRDRRNRGPKSKTGGRRIGSTGYVELRLEMIEDSDLPMFDAMRMTGNYVLEHRWVVAKHLGRALLPEENVHHKNGKRDDNRIDNLELWLTAQPYGQRVEDQVRWAREIIHRYGSMFPV